MKFKVLTRVMLPLLFLLIIVAVVVDGAPQHHHLDIENDNEIERVGHQPCPRYNAGSLVIQPFVYNSINGMLKVPLVYKNRTDPNFADELLCYMDMYGNQSPLLQVTPGDAVWITLTNHKNSTSNSTMNFVHCGSAPMDKSSVNLHFHGMNISPRCHADDVLGTIVDAGETFRYQFNIPANTPPGLYAYHGHIHGMADAALLGGASGAIIVEGIEKFQPSVIGLPERVLILRDYSLFNTYYHYPKGDIPSWDISLNYVPIPFPEYTPATIVMSMPNQREFWRVVNAGADTILNLQLLYDGVPQILQVVALDGVPLGSQDGLGSKKSTPLHLNYTELFLPPLARAEFIVISPNSSVTFAQFVTLQIDTGPAGDRDPFRPIADIVIDSSVDRNLIYLNNGHGRKSDDAADIDNNLPRYTSNVIPQRFAGLLHEVAAINRTLYFSEESTLAFGEIGGTINFYITVDGQTPELFNASSPPAIVSLQGTAEDWVIENHTEELHIFHIHQVHFLLLEINGVPVASEDQVYLDTHEVPYWTGIASDPYPSIKIRMDFRKLDVGTFVYHCHILDHEDNGMMAKIQIVNSTAELHNLTMRSSHGKLIHHKDFYGAAIYHQFINSATHPTVLLITSLSFLFIFIFLIVMIIFKLSSSSSSSSSSSPASQAFKMKRNDCSSCNTDIG